MIESIYQETRESMGKSVEALKNELKNRGKENRRTGEKANRRISNVEPQNVEGLYRCALS